MKAIEIIKDYFFNLVKFLKMSVKLIGQCIIEFYEFITDLAASFFEISLVIAFIMTIITFWILFYN